MNIAVLLKHELEDPDCPLLYILEPTESRESLGLCLVCGHSLGYQDGCGWCEK